MAIEAKRRIFFALWPGPEIAARLEESALAARRICGGRAMRRDTLHLTLAFLGEVEAAGFDKACAVADGIQARPAELLLDRLGWWRHNRILWAGCAETPPALAELAETLTGGLRAAGFRLDTRPFAAHLTLLRDARCPAEPPVIAPLAWCVTEFTLVESRLGPQGACYEIIHRWPLIA